jgi:hypothetical protein
MAPLGDNPQGSLVYTADGHVFVQAAARDERKWPGPEVLDLPPYQLLAAKGFLAYCGKFEVRDGQVIHHREFGNLLMMSEHRREPRSVVLDGDRLILARPPVREMNGSESTLLGIRNERHPCLIPICDKGCSVPGSSSVTRVKWMVRSSTVGDGVADGVSVIGS